MIDWPMLIAAPIALLSTAINVAVCVCAYLYIEQRFSDRIRLRITLYSIFLIYIIIYKGIPSLMTLIERFL